MEKKFKNLIDTLQDSIFTWSYFSDFKKVKNNTLKIERELNLLNSLVGKENLEDEFIDLIKEYPKVREVLPILIAIREKKIKEMQIISDIESWKPELKDYLFYDDLNEKSSKELLIFFKQSGLKNIFMNKNIKSIVDYVFGVEVGMDTNARKNRTGSLMEDIVEKFIYNFCTQHNDFEYLDQATKKKIEDKWGYKIKIDKSDRQFDFVIFNKRKRKLFIIEVNYYSSGGSKLKAVAGEFQELHSFLKNQNLSFYWITDGQGWLTAKKPLEETFIKIGGNIL
ncbi:restriction endonuclease, partial [Candidatus Parcubacteria bacterium]|nr:restriction endonuclease [Candidatus Parcubacteria bacterium]